MNERIAFVIVKDGKEIGIPASVEKAEKEKSGAVDEYVTSKAPKKAKSKE